MSTIAKFYNGVNIISIFWSNGYNKPAIAITSNNEKKIIPYDFKNLSERLDLYSLIKTSMKFSVYCDFTEKKFFIFFPEKNPRILPKFRNVDLSLLNSILNEIEQKSELKLENWQKEAIIEILKRGIVILKQNTGTGKTIQSLLVLEYYRRLYNQLNFLILTTTKEVVDQFFDEKEKWKLDIDLIRGENITYFRSFATKFKKELNEDLRNNKDEYLRLIKSEKIKNKIEMAIDS
ncbi:MAG: DEAD/DEAH box helicase family protein, partial [Nanopusillaceae archaeon]